MISVLVVGLPGKMATTVARHVLRAKDMRLLPFSITGPEVEETEMMVNRRSLKLISCNDETRKSEMIEKSTPCITVDFTEPQSVDSNIAYYCRKQLPFVMGTTGVVVKKVQGAIEEACIKAVIAPNMAKQIVALQAMFEYAGRTFPGCFKGYSLRVTESHQCGKGDTSGTARSIVGNMNRLGVRFGEDEIVKIRDPKKQVEMGIPESALEGHGWHRYTLQSEDGTVVLEFVHNINGREIYAEGTLSAVRFLAEQVGKGGEGRVYTMVDVLEGL